MKKKVKLRQIGITLIALVTTIIVLLILAGTTINMVIGDNGIIKAAKAEKIKEVKGELQDELEMKTLDTLSNLGSDPIKFVGIALDKIKSFGLVGINKISITTSLSGHTSAISKQASLDIVNINKIGATNADDDTDKIVLDTVILKDGQYYNMIVNINIDGVKYANKRVMQIEDLKPVNELTPEAELLYKIISTIYNKVKDDSTDIEKILNSGCIEDDNISIIYVVADEYYISLPDIVVKDKKNDKFYNLEMINLLNILNKVSKDNKKENGEVYLKKFSPSPIKMTVNTGNNGIVYLPISGTSDFSGKINWGDGTEEKVTYQPDEQETSNTKNIGKLATISEKNKLVLASGNTTPKVKHQYENKNTEYKVTLDGICAELNSDYISNLPISQEDENKVQSKLELNKKIASISGDEQFKIIGQTNNYNDYYSSKIISIEDWGNALLQDVNFENCINLKSVASPRKESFRNIKTFFRTFKNCTSLQNIPGDLFNNCPSLGGNYSDGEEEFKIPAEFGGTFYGCTALTGNAPEIWNTGTNNSDNKYKGTPDGQACFSLCTTLKNYNTIPEYWNTGNYDKEYRHGGGHTSE